MDTKKRTRKPLTPEQRAKKNAAARAKRAAATKNRKPALPLKPAKPKLPAKGGKPKLPSLLKKTGKFSNRPPKIKQNGFTRPAPVNSKGKPRKTFRVWEIADKISADNVAKYKAAKAAGKNPPKPQPATRKEVFAACKKERIPFHTMNNSFYQWRKFNGLFLRVKLDGTLSKPMGPGHGPAKKGKKAKAKASNPIKKKPAKKAPSASPAVDSPAAPAPAVPVIPEGSSDLALRTPAPAPVMPTGKPPLPAAPAPDFIAPPPV